MKADLERIIQKNNLWKEIKEKIPKDSIRSFRQDFCITYAHNSTAIEGNTLTLIETKAVLEDGLSVGGKSLREIFEVYNHQRAFEYVEGLVCDHEPLNESIVKEIHAKLMENIMVGGVYRDGAERIGGASFQPPAASELFYHIKNFYADLQWKINTMHPVEFAAWTHAEFVKIHPYFDGNGRTSRMIMNYQLMYGGYLPVNIRKEERLDYYRALDCYGADNKLDDFIQLIISAEERELDKYLQLAVEQGIIKGGGFR